MLVAGRVNYIFRVLPPKTDMAMEHSPFEDVFPIEKWGFSISSGANIKLDVL